MGGRGPAFFGGRRHGLAFFTPLPAEAAPLVRFVKLGKLRLNLEGEELPHV